MDGAARLSYKSHYIAFTSVKGSWGLSRPKVAVSGFLPIAFPVEGLTASVRQVIEFPDPDFFRLLRYKFFSIIRLVFLM